MSVFDLPRLHFVGTATTALPTGPRQGLVDLGGNCALTPKGGDLSTEPGVASVDAPGGGHHGANGHFIVDAAICAVETRAGGMDVHDALVGAAVDFWGHYNEYLQTTVNRARIFDVDPSSNWTTTLMIGQFGLGRRGRSHTSGYDLAGTVNGMQPPRWHCLGGEGLGVRGLGANGAVVHQFAVTADELTWFEGRTGSPAVTALREVIAESAAGVVVQFALLAGPDPAAEGPRPWRLRGTIAPWFEGELRTYPAGRLLIPANRRAAPALTVDIGADGLTLNLLVALEVAGGMDDLALRGVATGTVIAGIPSAALGAARRTSGVVHVPVDVPGGHLVDEPVEIVSTRRDQVIWREQEINIQSDDAVVILEHPRDDGDGDHDVDLEVLCRIRGRPAARHVRLVQVPHPRALPPAPNRDRAEIVRFIGPGGDAPEVLPDRAVVRTGDDGVGVVGLRGARPGSTRILFTTEDIAQAGPGYVDDDIDGSWSGAGYLSVRVLPDDWWLDDVPDDDVDFDLVHREVFASYEAMYSFMRDEVFSLADRCKVETYAQLIWQMCDPRNRDKTYYMPPSRDLSLPKARLLLRYLRAQQAAVPVPDVRPGSPSGSVPATRADLVSALREAANLELAVMLQYVYAAYSVPTFGAGEEYVRRGLWSAEQLRLACGDGGETLDGGLRGVLIRIAREEMIHFLLVNNILAALGEPFHLATPVFGVATGGLLAVRHDLSRLSVSSLDRFVDLERPAGPTLDVSWPARARTGAHDDDLCSSIGELYAQIKRGLAKHSEGFLVRSGRGGGEHHLFLREQLNLRHPDYQLEVDDLESALFAIDVITEQGEGGPLTDSVPGDGPTSAASPESSHFSALSAVAALVRDGSWSPAYPVLENPSVHLGQPGRRYVPDPHARRVMLAFNEAYAVMLELMAQHFTTRADASLRRSRLMNTAIDVMTGIMRPVGEVLVTMPAGIRGLTAGPSFEIAEPPVVTGRDDVALLRMGNRLDRLADRLASCPELPSRVHTLSQLLARTVREAVT